MSSAEAWPHQPFGDRPVAIHEVDEDTFGPVVVSRVLAQKDPVPLTKQGGAFAAPTDTIALALVLRGTVTLDFDGRIVVVGAAEMTLFDLDRVAGFSVTEDFKAVILKVDGDRLPLSPAEALRLSLAPMSTEVGSCSVFRAATLQMYWARADLDDDSKERLGHSLLELAQIIVRERLLRSHPVGAEVQGTVAVALSFIEQNLFDPRLSPAVVAQAQGISVRKLHLAFAGEPFTVARTIAIRRLSGARLDLESRAGTSASIAAIATRWGFVSTSHFSRAFREAFGMSPREWCRTRGLVPTAV